ncbi:hypothetical protein T09_13138, partial [Trichinella sp. T9]
MRSKCAITKISTHFAHYRNGLHHQHRALSYSCVCLGWLNGVTQYWSRNLCLHPERQMLYDQQERRCPIRNHVDKYVITKHYYQLMPLSLATYSKKTRKLW